MPSFSMPSLSGWFEKFIFGGEENSAVYRVVSVIGSGGKTSLIWLLAFSLSSHIEHRRKILVTPTTKIFVPPPEAGLYNRYLDCHDNSGNALFEGVPGVTLAGLFSDASGKLESLPLGLLEKAIAAYDLTLIEGDGSRSFPLKAWTDEEPVVPPFTDMTIGMLPVWPLGEPVSEKLIHRLPEFTSLTGAVPGEALKPEHFIRLIINGEAGLFAKARGRKILFFNQVECGHALRQARDLVESLPLTFRRSLSGIISGSVRENRIEQM